MSCSTFIELWFWCFGYHQVLLDIISNSEYLFNFFKQIQALIRAGWHCNIITNQKTYASTKLTRTRHRLHPLLALPRRRWPSSAWYRYSYAWPYLSFLHMRQPACHYSGVGRGTRWVWLYPSHGLGVLNHGSWTYLRPQFALGVGRNI